jgi:hypothetical protein
MGFPFFFFLGVKKKTVTLSQVALWILLKKKTSKSQRKRLQTKSQPTSKQGAPTNAQSLTRIKC